MQCRGQPLLRKAENNWSTAEEEQSSTTTAHRAPGHGPHRTRPSRVHVLCARFPLPYSSVSLGHVPRSSPSCHTCQDYHGAFLCLEGRVCL